MQDCCSVWRRVAASRPTPTTRSSPRSSARRWTCVEMPDPGFLLPDWVITTPAAHRHLRLRRQAGVHGLGRGQQRQPDARVLVDAAGARSRGRRRGGRARPRGGGRRDRRPRRPEPVAVVRAARRVADLPRVRGGRPQPVLELPDAAASRPASTSAPRGTRPAAGRRSCPRTRRCCSRCPTTCPTRSRCSPTRSRCRCTRSPGTRRRRGEGARVRRGALGYVRGRDPRARSTPTSRSASSRASARRRDLARKLGAHEVFPHEPAEAVIEAAAEWSGGVLASHTGLPMAFPGGIDVVYDTISKKETLGGRRPAAEGARNAREGRRPRHHQLGVHPALLQGAELGRLERVRHRGGRRRARARHPPLPRTRPLGAGRASTACSPTRSRSTRSGATRSRCWPPRTAPARSRSRSTSAA